MGAAWNRFFFEPQETSTLALFRIGFGGVMTLWSLALLPNLFAFFGPGGVLPRALPQGLGRWSLLNLFPGVPALAIVWLALLAGSISLVVGYHSRLASLAVCVCLIAFERRNPQVLNAGDDTLRVLSFYLVLAPSGAALSWERWRADRERFWSSPLRAPWALRLLQIQLSVIYFSTVWAKLQGETWRGGTAVTYAMRVLDIVRFPPPSALTGSVVMAELLTFSTLLVELSIAIFVWNRRARPWVLGLGVLLHLSIEVTIMVGFFSLAMCCLYLVFVPPETATRWVHAVRRWWTRGVTSEPTKDAVSDTPVEALDTARRPA